MLDREAVGDVPAKGDGLRRHTHHLHDLVDPRLPTSQPIWAWVKIKPTGSGPQVLVLGSICQGLRHFGYLILTHGLIFQTQGSIDGDRDGEK